MKKLKYFEREKYQNEVHVLESKLKAYNEFLRIADKVSAGAKTMDDIVKHIKSATGFPNPRMGADALLILDDFNQLIALEAIWNGINFTALEKVSDKEYQIKEAHLESLKELYKVYYETEDAKQIIELENIVTTLNKLDMPFRASLSYHPTQQFYFWNKTHTDSNMRRYSKKALNNIKPEAKQAAEAVAETNSKDEK